MSSDNFHFQVQGTAGHPRMVFLHGLLGSGANWRKMVTHWQSHYEILTYDQRGHGRSFQPLSGYGPDDYASDLLFLLEHLRWEKIILIGHSMGARNALAFAGTHPERLHALVLEDIPASNMLVHASRTEERLRWIPTPFPDRRSAKEYFMNEFVSREMNDRLRANPDEPRETALKTAQVLGQFFYANIVEDSAGRGVWRFSLAGALESIAAGRSRDWLPVFASLKVPTLLMRGEFSDELTREECRLLAAQTPLIEVDEVPAAGHWIHSDQPAAFCASVDQFLSRTSIPL